MKIWEWLVEKWQTRPAETRQAGLQTLGGSFLIVYGAFQHGVDFTSLNAESLGALGIVFAWIAAIKTWLTAKKQRDPREPIEASIDGSVKPVAGMASPGG
jgi:hypothetical protein